MLGEQDGFKGAVTVTGHVDFKLAHVGLYALRSSAVALVAGHVDGVLQLGDCLFFFVQVCGELAAERRLQKALGDLVYQLVEATLTGKDALFDEGLDGLVENVLCGGTGSFRSAFTLGLGLHDVLSVMALRGRLLSLKTQNF